MKRLTILTLVLITVITSSAQIVTSEQALNKAYSWLQKRQGLQSKGYNTNSLTLKPIAQNEITNGTDGNELYIYNIGTDNGFIIVSGDDRMPAILGYAESGSIDPKNMPESMRWWLEMYAQEISNLKASQHDAKMYASAYHSSINPLIKAEWNQNAPYNLQCPTIGGQRCVTGCVATAMAQVLSYVRPDGSKAIASRNGASALSSTNFNWNIIHNTYSENDQTNPAQEVAKLMRYCGQAAAMVYGLSESSASSAPAADGLKHYFNISNSCHIVERQFCTASIWDNIIYNELSNSRPVILSGQNLRGGHCFVCDGYDSDGLYHINWGWGGISNGYFLITALSPSAQGIGGTNSGYNSDLDAIIGIKKKTSSETDENISVMHISDLTSNVNTATIVSGTTTLGISSTIFCLNTDGITNYEFCWGVYDSNDNLLTTSDIEEGVFSPGSGVTFGNITLSNLTDGNYRMKFISRQKGAQTWGVSNNVECFTVGLNVNGNTATISMPQVKGDNENYNISDVKVTGNGLVNKYQTIEIKVKNTGNKFSGTIYIVDGNTIIGSLSVNLDPGETEILTGQVIFNNTGTRNIKFYKGAGNGYQQLPNASSYSYTVYSQSYTNLILSGKPANNYIIENGVYIINDSNLEMQCTVNNNTATDYRSYILYWLGTTGNNVTFITDGYAYVPANNSATVTHPVMELEENVQYDFYLSYNVSANTYKEMNAADRISVMYKKTSTAINDIHSPYDSTDVTYSLDGRRVAYPTRGIYIRNGKKIVIK